MAGRPSPEVAEERSRVAALKKHGQATPEQIQAAESKLAAATEAARRRVRANDAALDTLESNWPLGPAQHERLSLLYSGGRRDG